MLKLVALVAIALSTTAAFAQDDADTPVARHGQLKVDGSRIVDASGEAVQLRGMSLFWSQWMGQYYNADAVKWLVDDWNCNLVRAAVGVHSDSGYLQDPDAEWAKLEAVVDAAIEQGVYVIVDWHSHDIHTDEAVAFFGKVAERWGDEPNLIYEPYNEPTRQDWSTEVKPYHEAVIAAIREHDPDNLVILGSPTWSQDVDVASEDPVDDANVAYTLHFYAGTHGQYLRDKARKAMDNGVALFATEWGTSEATGDGKFAVDETRQWLAFLDEHGISWANWSVADKDETSAALTPGAAGKGGWGESDLSPSGKFVRQQLREAND